MSFGGGELGGGFVVTCLLGRINILFLFCSFGILEDPIDGFKDMWLQRTISVVCTGPKMSINIFLGIDNCLYYRHTLQRASLIRKPGFPNLQWQIR